MVERKRDASVGPEWLAYWALQGDEPPECLTEYMKIAAEVGQVESFLIFLLAEALDPKGTSDFQLKLVRRKAGKPINRHERAIRGRRAAGMVERLTRDGMKQEAAIAEVKAQTGLSRAEIFAWMKNRRRSLDHAADLKAVPRVVDYLIDRFKREQSSQIDE